MTSKYLKNHSIVRLQSGVCLRHILFFFFISFLAFSCPLWRLVSSVLSLIDNKGISSFCNLPHSIKSLLFRHRSSVYGEHTIIIGVAACQQKDKIKTKPIYYEPYVNAPEHLDLELGTFFSHKISSKKSINLVSDLEEAAIVWKSRNKNFKQVQIISNNPEA